MNRSESKSSRTGAGNERKVSLARAGHWAAATAAVLGINAALAWLLLSRSPADAPLAASGKADRLIHLEETPDDSAVRTLAGAEDVLARPDAGREDLADAIAAFGRILDDSPNPTMVSMRALRGQAATLRRLRRWEEAAERLRTMIGLPVPPGATPEVSAGWEQLRTAARRELSECEQAAAIRREIDDLNRRIAVQETTLNRMLGTEVAGGSTSSSAGRRDDTGSKGPEP